VRRILVALIGWLLLASAAQAMTPYVVNSQTKTQASNTSITSTNLSTTTSGDALLVVVETATNPTSIAISADTGNNTWSQVGSLVNWTGTKYRGVFVSANIVGAANHTVTAQFNGGATSCVAAIMAVEIAGGGLLTSAFVDNTASAAGTSNAPAAGNVTLANPNELVISVFSTTASLSVTSLPAGYTALSSLGSVTASAESLEGAWSNVTTSPQNPTWKINASNTWGCQAISLTFQILPTAAFNSSTGSDTAASGAGPSTALTGTAGAPNSNQTVNISDAVNLSGVALDGSAVLWVNTASGRQFSRIINITGTSGAWVVTTQDSYGVTTTGLTWGIGGKRATWDNANSRKLFTADVRAGWAITADDATAAQLTTSAISFPTSGDLINGPVYISGTGSSPVVCNQTANAGHFTNASLTTTFVYVSNLKFTNSNGIKTSATVFTGAGSVITIKAFRCIFGDTSGTNKIQNAFLRTSATINPQIIDCEVVNCTSDAISAGQSNGTWIQGCWIHGNAGNGVVVASISPTSVVNCLITSNTGTGVIATLGSTAMPIEVLECTIHGNGTGIAFSGVTTVSPTILNNNITGNSIAGINAAPGQINIPLPTVDYNNLGTGATANGVAYKNITSGAHDLAVDPGYVNAGANNFAVGANVQAKGFPDATRNIGANQSGTVNFGDIGAAQHKATGGVRRPEVRPSGSWTTPRRRLENLPHLKQGA
jgi:hypothetical protein